MTLHTEQKVVVCSQCHKPRWFAALDPIPDPFVCWFCERHNEIREGLRRSSRPAA